MTLLYPFSFLSPPTRKKYTVIIYILLYNFSLFLLNNLSRGIIYNYYCCISRIIVIDDNTIHIVDMNHIAVIIVHEISGELKYEMRGIKC